MRKLVIPLVMLAVVVFYTGAAVGTSSCLTPPDTPLVIDQVTGRVTVGATVYENTERYRVVHVLNTRCIRILDANIFSSGGFE